jgi:hypothetical protein
MVLAAAGLGIEADETTDMSQPLLQKHVFEIGTLVGMKLRAPDPAALFGRRQAEAFVGLFKDQVSLPRIGRPPA